MTPQLSFATTRGCSRLTYGGRWPEAMWVRCTFRDAYDNRCDSCPAGGINCLRDTALSATAATLVQYFSTSADVWETD
ncbi:hypothetical protein KSP40_PGU019706 [Platanthera guangdongensis]|uniref:Uncharacterized protein n=1 Tax=Platanthera guangdongensis TaxID=2320717 RepID=A0ABR2LZW6_9ASPA